MERVATLVFLFSLGGGYALLRLCYRTRYRAEALEWERNLFESGLAGLLLFICARVLMSHLVLLLPHNTVSYWTHERHRVGLPFVGTFLFSLALAALISKFWNRIMCDEAEAVALAVQDYGSEFLALLHRVAAEKLAVSVTMDSRKVYIGYIPSPPTIKDTYVKLLPLVSGHRKSSDLTLKIDVRYYHVYKSLAERRRNGETDLVDMSHFHIILPVSRICSANIFDDNTYEDYFESKKETPGPSREPAG